MTVSTVHDDLHGACVMSDSQNLISTEVAQNP